MIYEVTIQYIKVDSNGNDRTVRQSYVVENEETFGQTEDKAYREFQDYTDIDVIAVKRSKIHEIANQRTNENERLWLAEVIDIFHADDGEEKEMKYLILLFSDSFDNAKSFIHNYLKQSYNMTLTGLKRTKHVDVLR